MIRNKLIIYLVSFQIKHQNLKEKIIKMYYLKDLI